VLDQGAVVSTVDARAGALGERAAAPISQPAAADAAAPAAAQSADAGGFPWLLLLAVGAGLGGLALLAARPLRS
jgi:hypothetical protein